MKRLLLCILCILCQPYFAMAQEVNTAEHYSAQAEAFREQGRMVDAALLYEKSAAAELASPEKNLARAAERLFKAGTCYEAARQFEKAIAQYQQMLELDRTLGREVEIAADHNIIGEAYATWGKYAQAIEWYHQALELVSKLGQEAAVASCLNNIGLAYNALGQHDKAIKQYRQALEICRKLGDETTSAKIYNNIGVVFSSLEEYDQAITSYKQALDLYRKLDDAAGIPVILINLGRVYINKDEVNLGLHYFQQAQVFYQSLGKDAEVANLLNQLGNLFAEGGQYDQAFTQFQQALAIYRKLNREVDVGASLVRIGTIYHSWGQTDKALEYYQQALSLAHQLGRESGVAFCLTAVGSVYANKGQFHKALEYFQQAMAIERKLGLDEEVAANLNNIGAAHLLMGQHEKAIDHLHQSVELYRKLGLETKTYETLFNIGTIYSARAQHDKALDIFWQVLENFRRINNGPSVASVLNSIGGVYFSMGQYDKAIEYYRGSIALREKIRKTATGDIRRDYLASVLGTYQHLAEVYAKTQDHQGLLEAIEQSRARLLAEQISGIEPELQLPTLAEVQQGLAADEAVLLFSNIDQDNVILMVITGSEVVVKELPKESFLVQGQRFYKDKVLLLLEKQRGFDVQMDGKKKPLLAQETGKKGDFETAVRYLRTSLIHGTPAGEARGFNVVATAKKQDGKEAVEAEHGLSRLFYDFLVGPVEESLAGKKKITILPDGILGFLPFEALVDHQNHYLAEKYAIQYAPSLTINALLKKRDYPANRRPMLAMGGALYNAQPQSTRGPENALQLAWIEKEATRAIEQNHSMRAVYAKLGVGRWANLPGTLAEVRKVAQIVPGAEILTGSTVSENTVKEYSKTGKLAQYKMLLFATHGMVVPEIPELSSIVLSQPKEEQGGEDGYLRMGEIAKLDIKADFVNLSACETGLGKIYGGEGIVGLTQSFLVAGANGLSVSLWQVADASTSRFMSELYKKVQQLGIGYSQAVAEVKRDFIKGVYGKKWQAPYYWSPFVYYGR